MIGRVYRGDDSAGLVRYLYGPGRHNEHREQHLVASWRGSDRETLDRLEPAAAGGGFDRAGLSRLSDLLDVDLRRAVHPVKAPIWHCPLRVAPGDRTLSDAEWADVATDLMHRTGFARRGDVDGCRWVAVRHDDESIHVVAVLARGDGRQPALRGDFLRVRETCLAAERRYGLTVTAPADRTAAVHTSRQETERSARQGKAVPDRDWLRTQAQHAAAASRDPAAFLDQLRRAGVTVRERRDPADGLLTGYAVARPGVDGPEVFYGGGKLAADLSLPKLVDRWAGCDPRDGARSPAGPWEAATTAAAEATEHLRAAATGGVPEQGADAAAAAADLLAASARLTDGGAPLAATFDRAAREPGGRRPSPTPAGQALRTAALRLAMAGAPPQARQAALLAAQLARLTGAVVRLRQAQGRLAQAQAARAAQAQASDAGQRWVAEVVAARQRPAQAHRAGPVQPAPRRAAPPPPSRGRGR